VKKDKIPTLNDLLEKPVFIDTYPNRHIAVAGVQKRLALKLGSFSYSEEAEAWERTRESLGKGLVICPECEEAAEEGVTCELCDGNGMIPREKWEEWYFETKACRDFAPGCEKACKRNDCIHDQQRAPFSVAFLALDVHDGTKWVHRGDSIKGFKLKGLAKNEAALRRFLNLTAATAGVMRSDDEDAE
jgi:hypothetical protein